MGNERKERRGREDEQVDKGKKIKGKEEERKEKINKEEGGREYEVMEEERR